MKKLDQVRQKRLQSKTQSDIIHDNDKSESIEAVTPEIITEDSISSDSSVKSQLLGLLGDFERFSKNKDILAKLDPDKLSELEQLETNLKNTLKILKNEKKPNSLIIHPFIDSNITPKSSSIVDDAFFFFCTSKKLPIDQFTENSIRATKSFKEGKEKIYLIFQEVRESIENELGIDTFRVFSVFMAYWYLNKENIVDGTLKISTEDIFKILNRQNKFYYDDNKKKKRYSKIDNLKWLDAQIELLTNVKVYSSKIVITKTKDFKIPNKTNLIEFEETEYYPNYELNYIFKIGNWFKFFDDDENYYKHFGYLHREALSSEGIKSTLLNWLMFKLEQRQTGDFTVKTILEEVFSDKLEAILKENNSKIKSTLAKNLYRDFHIYLNEIKNNINDPYQWQYKNPQEWILDECLNKPRGKWWDIWVNTVIVFKHPKCLIAEGKNYKREKAKPEAKPTKLTANDLKTALAQYSDNKNVSLRKLAEAYSTSQPTLSRKLKSDKFTQQELKDLIRLTHFLGKK